jgi:tRNA (guanine37-N1)-methyltransferase
VKKAQTLSKYEHLIFVCGHYEGVDERIFELFPIEQISIGDYVLTGGELPTMVIIDCLSRFVDGVLSSDSLTDESFSNGLLEYPQYTRPQEFMGLKVPDVLVSGNHGEVEKWRKKQSLDRTKLRRSDLLNNTQD